MPKLDYSLAAVNQRLKLAKTKVALKLRGDSLYMVATLPPKPGHQRPKPYQQMIALHLPASEPGFKQAELKARKLGSQLALNEFDWEMYLDPEKLPGGKLVSVLVHEFKEHYMATHSLSEHSWKNEQHKIFSRLPQDQPLTNEILMERVVATIERRLDRAQRQLHRPLQRTR